MTEKKYKVNMTSKGGSFNANQFAPRIERSYYNATPSFDDFVMQGDYKEKNTQLSFELLNRVSKQVAPIAAVISTRIDQVGSFTSRSRFATNGVGFKVKLKNSNTEPTDEQLKTIDKIETFIENCGTYKDSERDDFDTFIRKILRDSLTYDQVNFELEYDITGEYLQAFEAVDASTIKPTLEDYSMEDSIFEDDINPREGEDISFVQVIDNKIVAGFTADEMAFAVRNPSTDVNIQPYGIPEIENIVRQLSSYLEAEDYNMRFFQQGGMTKGILNIKGEKGGPAPGDRQTLESFKRQWRTQVTGQKGAWKIPVFTLPGELEFINIAQSGGEMVFEKWINYLINIISAAYKIDPAEINFPNNGGVGGKGSSLFSGDKDKIEQSKSKGLLPLLQFVENTINKYIVNKFNVDDEYVFVFDGLDNESESEQVELAKKKSESYMTINEVRAEKGLSPIDGGDIIANPYFLQAMQLMPSNDSMDFDFGDFDDQESPGDEEESPPGEENEKVDDLFEKSLKIVNKELESERLFKGIDKSKLVLVDVDVNGAKGPYKAKRWKNPSAALNEIKKQMNIPKGATLTFISKRKKGKTLNEKQFKDYCRKVKPNVTLQQFISSNFDVKVNIEDRYKNNVNTKIEKIADRLIDKAKKNENLTTKDLVASCSKTLGSLEGLDYRIKSKESTIRKLDEKSKRKGISIEEYSNNVSDILRYTFCSEANNLVKGFFQMKSDLENKGYNIIEINNTFSILNTAYKGINTLVKNPNGYIFELQFHTYQSLQIKEKNHKLYEKTRLESTPREEKKKLIKKMIENSKKVIAPNKIDKIINLSSKE